MFKLLEKILILNSLYFETLDSTVFLERKRQLTNGVYVKKSLETYAHYHHPNVLSCQTQTSKDVLMICILKIATCNTK